MKHMKNENETENENQQNTCPICEITTDKTECPSCNRHDRHWSGEFRAEGGAYFKG